MLQSSPRQRVLAACALCIFLLSSVAATAAQSLPASLSGDVRVLVSGLERTDRNGIESDTDEGVMRLRVGSTWEWSERTRLVGRLATSASTNGNDWQLDWFETAQTTSGLAPGNTTLDLAYLQLAPTDGVRLRFGRFQESVALPGVPDKSLDRKDSDNMSINYSDGAALDWGVAGGWSLLAIAQYNPAEGPANRPRAPLAFTDSGSRVSGFFAMRKAERDGFWALRSLNLTVLPHTLNRGGDTSTYSAAVANVAVRWPASSSAMHLLAGGSLGYAPEVPQTVRMYGDSRWAWQATANLMNFARRQQSIGVVWMRSGAGWLLSPDLASNTQLWEIRYRVEVFNPLTIEARFRYRSDDEQLRTVRGIQRDRDWYLRATWRF